MSTSEHTKSEVDELFTVVNNEVTRLHTIWELFIQLYGSTDENFEIMNATAPQFFGIIKIILFDELVLILNRLADPPETFGNKNACLERLIDQIDLKSQAKTVSSLRSRLNDIRIKNDPFKTWRNKSISHKDLGIALEKESSLLPGIPRVHAVTLINTITNFVNEYSQTQFDKEQRYVPFWTHSGDATALLLSLKKSLVMNT